MPSLASLAFAFARFVAREHRRPRLTRNFGPAAAHRQSFGPAAAARRRNFGRNFGRRHQRRLNRNGGLRHRRTPLVAPRHRYGPGAGLRCRHNHGHHHGHRWVQREAAAAMPEAVHEAVAGATEEVVAVPEAVAIPPLVAAPVAAAPEREDEASASNISADVDDLLPPPPAFTVPPMEWLLGGHSAGWLVDEAERYFSDEEDEATPPLQYYLRHGYGPCLPSLTPSDEDLAHFAPPGYAPVPEFSSSSGMVRNQEKIEDAAPAAARSVVTDLNLPVPEEEEEENEDAAPSLTLPAPSPEARVLLRRFASAMAARPAGFRAGAWSPAHIGLTDRMGMLSLDDPTSRR